MKRIILFSLMTLALGAAETAQEWYQQALVKERSEGKLEEAMQLYRRAAEGAGKDRALASKALLQLGSCYEKLGNTESRRIYERIVREFGDQREVASQARERLGPSTAANQTGIATRQVWTGRKVSGSMAVSPDGRSLSFTDWSNGDLALHDLTTGQDRPLTSNGTWLASGEYAYGSAFSRDGKLLAYGWTVSVDIPSRRHFFELRVIPLNGGKPRVLFSQHEIDWIDLYDWSPDGKWLAVQLTTVNGVMQLALISTVDGSLRVLKSVEWRGTSKLAFSTDGRFVAYDLPASQDSEQRDIHLMPIDGSRDTPAVVHPANDQVLGWAADGKHLLFASNRSGTNGVWALPVQDGKPRGGPEFAKLVKADINPGGAIGVTQSGALYYFAQGPGVDIYLASVDFEAGKVLSPPRMVVDTYAGSNLMPQWSPDGKYLAYLSQRSAGNAGGLASVLAIRSMETGKVTELRLNLRLRISGHPGLLWSPDGASWTVNGTDRNGNQGIYRIGRQNGEATPLVMQDPGQPSPQPRAWSPDGSTLYIMRPDLKSKENVLLARHIQSGQEREIVRRNFVSGPTVSPDGRLLAVSVADGATKSTSLLVIPAEGGEPRELVRASLPEQLGAFVAWSTDGKFLHFRKFKGEESREPWRIPLAGGVPRRLELNGAVGPSPSIHPDGHQVAFIKGGPANSEVWVLENFLPGGSASK